MIRITGKTFDHKDALRELGARWNASERCWEAFHLSSSARARIRQMIGVSIVEGAPPSDGPSADAYEHFGHNPKPARPKPRHATIEQAIAAALAEPAKPKPGTVSKIHGNDPSWHNHFAEQNPISYHGFDSLEALVKHVETAPHSPDGNSAWQTGNSNFTGTHDMAEALELARRGWPEGLEIAEQISQSLLGQHATQRRRKYSVAGGSLNIGRLLAGNPMHMTSRPKQPGKKIITLFVEAGMLAAIDQENYVIRAGVVCAIVEILETQGYSCEIVVTDVTSWRNRPYCQIATTIKQAGEKLNLSDIVFALGHPSFARRFMFAVIEADPLMEAIHANMGHTGVVFTEDHPTANGEIFIDRITPEQQKHIDDDAPLIDKAMQIWNFVVPKNLPIKVRED